MRTNSTQDLIEAIEYVDDPQSHGPAMAALPPAERKFVHLIVNLQLPHATAAREAGFGRKEDGSMSEPKTIASLAYRLAHRQRVIDAIQEETRKLVRVTTPNAARALVEIVNDRHHRDRAKVALDLIERVDPKVQRVEGRIDHVHSVDHASEELNQYRALKALNVAREKLEEVFGAFGLERIEKRAALEDKRQAPMEPAANVIEAEYVEVKPARDPDYDILGD